MFGLLGPIRKFAEGRRSALAALAHIRQRGVRRLLPHLIAPGAIEREITHCMEQPGHY